MSGLALAIASVIEFLCGAATGIALGRRVPSLSWGRLANGLIGGIGGLLFVWPSARIPGVGRFLGHPANALTPTVLIGAAIAGVIGGVILVALAGFLRALIRD
ncbi:MAG TPA: hypothetical protein VNS34_04930 [Rhizobiaceae bacterium]|nr:hypothetical protein [Rhizobiaceae bacterium]